MARQRISLAKELRIKQLRDQGYAYEAIASIVNVRSKSAVIGALRRAMRHWKYADDPLLGRQRNFLSDSDIEDILERRKRGETCQSIGQRYHMSLDAISSIANGRTYINNEQGYPYEFTYQRPRRLL